MNTKEELYLEYARCINMCKGTEVKPWECVIVKSTGSSDLYARVAEMHPAFDADPKIYEFALFLLDGKPVFPGDILYLKSDGYKKCEVYRNGYNEISGSVPGLKKQEYVINTPFACSIQKKTPSFSLNFVKLPSPISTSLFVENVISIRSGRFVQHFEFESETDADLVALNIIKILMTACEEGSRRP